VNQVIGGYGCSRYIRSCIEAYFHSAERKISAEGEVVRKGNVEVNDIEKCRNCVVWGANMSDLIAKMNPGACADIKRELSKSVQYYVSTSEKTIRSLSECDADDSAPTMAALLVNVALGWEECIKLMKKWFTNPAGMIVEENFSLERTVVLVYAHITHPLWFKNKKDTDFYVKCALKVLVHFAKLIYDMKISDDNPSMVIPLLNEKFEKRL
jgi:hypothetical protein